MSTIRASGTLSSTSSGEQTVATLSTDYGTVWPIVDCNALTAGNYVTVRLKTKVLSGGTSRTVDYKTYNWLAAGCKPNLDLQPIVTDQECILTIQPSTTGSLSFPWKIISPSTA